jgi:hypothetical protein
MHTNHTVRAVQQRRIRERAEHADAFAFFNILTSNRLLDTVESQLSTSHRERLFPPTETLSMFLDQTPGADRSCQQAVNQSVALRTAHGLPICSAGTGAYCQARQRLPLELVTAASRATAQLMDEAVPFAWRWQGRPVRLVDGTTVTLPDTAENQAAFPQQRNQAEGIGFPICRIAAITDLSCGAVLDAAIAPYQGKGSGELALLRTLLDTFEAGDIVLADALYATYFLLVELQRRGVDVLMHQHGARQRTSDFRRGKKRAKKDRIATWSKPKKRPDWMSEDAYAAAPERLDIREIAHADGSLVTTMLCPKQAPAKALKALYQSRWNVELDLRDIKTTLGMNTLSCKTPQMAIKELWVYLLAYNLIRLLMAQSARLADMLPRELSFKHTLQIWLAWRQQGLSVSDRQQASDLVCVIAQIRVGNRPGRIEPRCVKRRPKPYALLMMPRSDTRALVREFGHPKKVK